MAYTKGPWKINKRADGQIHVVGPTGSFIAEVFAHNAPIVSAAPDLLEALKEMTESFEYHVENVAHHPAYKKAIAAIAKVEGEAPNG